MNRTPYQDEAQRMADQALEAAGLPTHTEALEAIRKQGQALEQIARDYGIAPDGGGHHLAARFWQTDPTS